MTSSRAEGFTLLETLVGLALLGLLTLVLFSALRFGTQSWERVEQKSIEVVDLAIAESTLRRQMGRAFPVRVGLANESKVGFEGDERGVKFFTALPAHFSSGGLSLVDVRFESSGDASRGESGRLLIRHALQKGLETEFAADQLPQSSTLITGLGEASFAYYGWSTEQGEPTWSKAWSQNARFPILVKLKLKFSHGEREMIIPLRLGEEAGCYQASFQRVCGPRR